MTYIWHINRDFLLWERHLRTSCNRNILIYTRGSNIYFIVYSGFRYHENKNKKIIYWVRINLNQLGIKLNSVVIFIVKTEKYQLSLLSPTTYFVYGFELSAILGKSLRSIIRRFVLYTIKYLKLINKHNLIRNSESISIKYYSKQILLWIIYCRSCGVKEAETVGRKKLRNKMK